MDFSSQFGNSTARSASLLRAELLAHLEGEKFAAVLAESVRRLANETPHLSQVALDHGIQILHKTIFDPDGNFIEGTEALFRAFEYASPEELAEIVTKLGKLSARSGTDAVHPEIVKTLQNFATNGLIVEPPATIAFLRRFAGDVDDIAAEFPEEGMAHFFTAMTAYRHQGQEHFALGYLFELTFAWTHRAAEGAKRWGGRLPNFLGRDQRSDIIIGLTAYELKYGHATPKRIKQLADQIKYYAASGQLEQMKLVFSSTAAESEFLIGLGDLVNHPRNPDRLLGSLFGPGKFANESIVLPNRYP